MYIDNTLGGGELQNSGNVRPTLSMRQLPRLSTEKDGKALGEGIRKKQILDIRGLK